MSEYTPIDCELYNQYELAILHHRRLRVCWRDTRDETHIAMLTPRDLQTREGAEFMIAEDQDGQSLELRLDWIQHVEML
ncbi:MAG: transcriptional antiterminator, Rof [Gammaproteobacteria bacterium]|nr:transcriptional antiterminator, Rof [Gammaproteobacteria bacterium]